MAENSEESSLQEQIVQKTIMKHDNAIDLMRGIAMIMVFLFHYGLYFGAPAAVQFGQMGCQIFFFASGFTCSISYASIKSKISKKQKAPLQFWKKRFLSLAPAFYTALIILWGYYALAGLIFPDHVTQRLEDNIFPLLCNFLLIHGFFPFCNDLYPGAWFIGTIVILYLLHPLIDRIYQKSRRPRVVTAMGILGFWALTLVFNRLLNGEWIVQNNTWGYFLFINQIGCYLLGMDLYYEREKETSVTAALCIAVFSLAAAMILFYLDLPLSFSLTPVLTGLFAYALYLLLKKIPEPENNPFRKKIRGILCRIGIDSLFIYLTHTFVVWNVVRRILQLVYGAGFTDFTLLAFLFLIPSALLAWLLAFLFRKLTEAEKRLFRWRD